METAAFSRKLACKANRNQNASITSSGKKKNALESVGLEKY